MGRYLSVIVHRKLLMEKPVRRIKYDIKKKSNEPNF